MEKTLSRTHSAWRNNTSNIVKKSCSQKIFSITSLHFSEMFPIFDVNKPHFVKCTYKEQHEGFGKCSWPFESIIISNHLYFLQEGNLQRNWQEQPETKEVALANLTLHTQKIPKDNNPIKVGLSFSEGSNTLINIDIGELKLSYFAMIYFIFRRI